MKEEWKKMAKQAYKIVMIEYYQDYILKFMCSTKKN